jgi:hypothetical protein
VCPLVPLNAIAWWTPTITVTLVLPIRRIDEIGCRATQRLSDLYCQAHAGGELRRTQSGQLTGSATNLFGGLFPSSTALGTSGIEGGVQFAQIPPKALGLIQSDC